MATLVGLRSAGRLLRDFATYLPAQAIPALAGFLALPILARKLPPLEMGILAIAQTLVSLGWTTVGAWLAAAIVRELPAARASGDLAGFRRTLVRGLSLTGVGLGLFLLLLASFSLVSAAVGQTALLVAAAIGAMVVQNTAVSLFAAGLRPRAYAATEVSCRVAGMAVGTVLVFEGHGVGGYLVGLASSSAVIGGAGLVAAWPRLTDHAPQPSAPALRAWIAYGVPASAGSIVLWALTFVDRYILALLKDATAVGIYTMGNTLGDRVIMVPMFAFATAATPLLVTAFERRGRHEVERLMRSYTRFVFIVGIPCIAYVAVAGGYLVDLVSGLRYAEYAPAAAVAPIVAVGSLLFALAGMANTGLAVARRTRYLVLSSAIGLTVNVAANLVLIPDLGVKGAAIATPVGNGAYLLATYWWSRSYATWRIPWPTLARAAVAAAAGAGATLLVSVSRSQPLLNLLLAAAVGLPVYVAVLAVLGEHRRGDVPR